MTVSSSKTSETLTLEPSTAPRLGHAGERGCAPCDPRSRGGSRHSHSGNPRYRPYGPVAFIWELFLFQASASVGSASKKRRSISVVRRELYGAPAKKSSGPENRDASILVGKHIANAMIFSTVFDRFRAPRSIEASASVDSASKKRRSISVEKCTARQQKNVRAPKTATRRFY